MNPERRQMLREGFVPPWLDKATLILCTGFGSTTIDTHVANKVLPPPRKRGGKLMWKWSEVDEWLTVGKSVKPAENKAERIRNAARNEAAASSRHG